MLGIDPISVLTGGYMLVSGNACPPQPAPEFDIQVSQRDANVDETHTAAQITALKVQQDQGAMSGSDSIAAASAAHDAGIRQAMSMEGDSFYNGLTLGKLSAKITYAIKSVPVGPINLCLYADKLSVTLNYDPQIYIAAEYASRPCPDRVVRAHEALHVEKDQQAISEFLPRAKASMNEFLAGLGGQGPYPEGELNSAAQQLEAAILADLENGVMPALAMMRQQYQEGIDTPENYRYNASLCPAADWMPASDQ
jgi:hypothetical protein